MTGAGDLDRRLRFEARAVVDDGYGNTVSGDFAEQFTRWAKITWRRGGEAVLAGRLEGRQPAIVRVRRDSETATITSDWRCVDINDGSVFAVREDPTMTEDRHYLEFMVERGVAA